MTTPQGPSRGNPPEWNRPTQPGPNPVRRPAPPPPPQPPSGSPTERIPQRGRPYPPPPPQPPGPPPQPPGPPPQQTGRPPTARPYPPPRPPAPGLEQEQATTRLSTTSPALDAPTKKPRRKRPKALIPAIVLVVILVLLIGAELLIRQVAGNKVASAVACEVEDSATVSFAVMPPMLWQYLSGDYPEISVETAGNQVRSAKGMKVSIDIKDLRLNDTGSSKGTIGAVNGTITWSSDGIKQSVQDAIPVLGSFVTSKVTTNPGQGTIELKGMLDSVTVKPRIVNNGLALQVVNLTALGSKMSTDTVQKNLDSLTSKATENYPLGIHAETVKVTDTGLEATFSTTNATIPASSSSTQNDCFSGV